MTVAVVNNTGGNVVTVFEETPDAEICVELETLPAGGLTIDIEVTLEFSSLLACESIHLA